MRMKKKPTKITKNSLVVVHPCWKSVALKKTVCSVEICVSH